MVSKDEDMIDFNKLDHEFEVALEADAKYWRENDAKFRAVGQKVGTYEEFRDIVLAAHIKPLEKGDKIGESFNQPWNIAAGKNQDSSQGKEPIQIKQDSGKFPKNNQEFVRDWRRYCKTSQERYSFLKTIGCENLRTIFKTEFGLGVLGEIFSTLKEHDDIDIQFIYELLETLSKAKRFGLSIDFLSKDEKDSCRRVFDRLKTDSQNLSDSQKESLLRLEGLYKLT